MHGRESKHETNGTFGYECDFLLLLLLRLSLTQLQLSAFRTPPPLPETDQ